MALTEMVMGMDVWTASVVVGLMGSRVYSPPVEVDLVPVRKMMSLRVMVTQLLVNTDLQP
jgi:hypothetical protein